MAYRRSAVLLVVGVSAFITLGLGILVYQPVQAQCGDNPPQSSCITCHEKEAPVTNQGYWHEIHAQKDCCAKCHGGNCSAADKDRAHVGMMAQPLKDVYLNCAGCHPDDYQQRAGKFAGILGVTPGSSPTATPVSAGPFASQQMVIPQPAAGGPAHSLQALQALGFLALVGFFLFALSQIARHPAAREPQTGQVH
jgi:hypothetical protein